MRKVTRKTEIGPVDGTPEKRMFWSIISDYDLQTGVCELVDNALDLWMVGKQKGELRIAISLEVDRQLISIKDNAGGVEQKDLRLLVAPGGSRNDPNAEIIGIFGVGSKRAGVALGEQVVMKTRHGTGQTFQVDITNEWLESPDWEIQAYAIPDIDAGTTQVEISHLRKPFAQVDVDELVIHLGETYDWFLRRKGCQIKVNRNEITPQGFEMWAFPPGFEPRTAVFELAFPGHDQIKVEVTAGLIRDRVPEADNYGVYFYCNHRLIVKELKTREVGYFITSEAGVPHPDASLCRVIVRLDGPARLMPWNSSKTGLNFHHQAFQQIRPTLIQLVSHFSSLSRRLKDNWDGKVFGYTSGKLQSVNPADLIPGKRLILPPLPRVNKAHVEELKARNKTKIQDQPWTLGLVEAVAAVDVIVRQKLQTKNRIALVLLDSNFEIALKEFIVHRTDSFPQSQFNDAAIQALFKDRRQVIAAVSQKVVIPKKLLDKAKHYYGLRNKLIHERATVGITDEDVDNYHKTIQRVLKILFGLNF